MDSRDAANRDLLFGLLALQNGLIDQSALVAAFQAWTLDKSRPIAEVLVARGSIDPGERALLEGLADRHRSRHGGDTERSLAALNPGRSDRECLATLADPDIERTLARFGPGPIADGDDVDRTAAHPAGTAQGDHQRFRVLRPHARGGLGAVFVALDAELHREVALKQILDRHADDPASRARFVLEAEITGGLEHPGIVPVYGLGTSRDGRPYYAMRFVRGDTLKDAIASRTSTARRRGRTTRATARWASASSCAASPTSATRSTMPTRAASCTGISNRATSSSAATARRS